MTIRSTIFKNVSWIVLEKLSKGLLGLILLSQLSRYLGPEKYGVYVLIIGFFGIMSSFSGLGVDQILIDKLEYSKRKRLKILFNSLYLKFFGFLIFALVAFLLMKFILDYDGSIIINFFIIYTSIFFQNFNIFELYFNSQNNFSTPSVINIVSYIVAIGFSFFSIITSKSLSYFFFSFLLQQIVYSTLIYIYFLKRFTPKKTENIKLSITINKEILRSSMPLFISVAAISLQSNIDKLMIERIIGINETAYYGAAISIFAFFGIIPTIINKSTFPTLTKLYHSDENSFTNKFKNFIRLMFILSIIVTILICLSSQTLINLLFGKEYLDSSLLLILISFRIIILFISIARNSYFIINGLGNYILITVLISTLLNVTLNFMFINLYGIYGAILATYISSITEIFILDRFFIKTKSFSNILFNSIFLANKN